MHLSTSFGGGADFELSGQTANSYNSCVAMINHDYRVTGSKRKWNTWTTE